ncbi:hypothetical protein [Streptomyces sp. JJ36]|uniref:hypothetical protein n=1 Tax=Streptomyces sp. JJ36 TaxID=2736645 RepID=UPI001F2C724A|nr:hypothetical protein [Streptomyces sp. JJ36]MCF6523824.1 hypothetical protein [Streptomyces sp. JJ36]
MSSREARTVFAQLRGFGANWIELGEHGDMRQATAAAIASEHPFCREFLLPIAVEAQRALVLFPADDLLDRHVRSEMPWITRDAVRELLHFIDDHMHRKHATDA